MIKFLLWLGFVKWGRKSTVCDIAADGQIVYRYPVQIIWPFHMSPWWIIRHHVRFGPRVYVFRNVPGIIKWEPGRVLPRRWGIGVCGFEFGDRG